MTHQTLSLEKYWKLFSATLRLNILSESCKKLLFHQSSSSGCRAKYCVLIIANEAADPRGSAVELANHRAVREYRRKISSQRKGLFLTIFGCK